MNYNDWCRPNNKMLKTDGSACFQSAILLQLFNRPPVEPSTRIERAYEVNNNNNNNNSYDLSSSSFDEHVALHTPVCPSGTGRVSE